MVLLLPITSFPLLAHLMGGIMVAPASLLPLGWLVVWFTIFVASKRQLPAESVPFLAFVSLAFLSSAVAFFREFPTFKAHHLLETEFSGLITLGVAAAFYLVSAAWLSDSPLQFEQTLRIVNYTGLILLAWSGLQAIIIVFFNSHYPKVMVDIQSFFSVRGLFPRRVTGFAFEPSWLAHQINLFFLPVWMAASAKRFSAHRLRLWKLQVEDILLVGSILTILLASRIGTVALLMMVAFLAIRIHLGWFAKIRTRLKKRLNLKFPLLQFLARVLFFTLLISFLVLLYLLALFSLLVTMTNFDPRVARLFDLDAIKINFFDPYALFNQLAFAERYVYWVTGWRIFNDYPLLGVGIGNAGLYFLKYLPSYAWVLVEVMESVYRLDAVMNIKSFWVRILAETGLVGFSAFLSWIVVLWQTSRFLETRQERLMNTLGLAGKLALIAFVAEGFSTDTFALPYLWLILGIVSAAGMIARYNSPATDNDLLPFAAHPSSSHFGG